MGDAFTAWLAQEAAPARRASPDGRARSSSSSDGLDDAPDSEDDLLAVLSVETLQRGGLNAGAPGGDAEDEEDDEALVAEKIALLQEENARLRAAASAAPPAPQDGAAAAASGDAAPGADAASRGADGAPGGAASGEASGDAASGGTIAGVADWLLAAAKEVEKASYEARWHTRACCAWL
jgi:hypothetical protein